MSLDEVLPSSEWAFAFAAALAGQFGDDRILTVGSAPDGSPEAPDVSLAADESTRAVRLPFTTADGHRGTIVLRAVTGFAEALERTSPDELLRTACQAAFEAARRAIADQAVVEVVAEAAFEPQDEGNDAANEPNGDATDDAVVVYPLLDGGEVVGSLTLRVGARRESESDPRAPVAAGGTGDDADAGSGNTTGASYVLADVEMGVTAELGRCRMTMRELLSITPGAVIDLDRAAGAPVDVLVNGTLIARGEVVVVDEEFGIRISELVPQPAAAR
jgi:flagellar motor switch protein FliN